MLPVTLNFGKEMTVAELIENRGAWHKSDEKRPRRQTIDRFARLFCQRVDGDLHEFATLGSDETIRQMATELNETELMARMTGGDLVALDGKYHLQY